MRHSLGYRKLNKTPEHRKALFKNMLNSLIKYEQITTTLPKAKELKPLIDKVITIGKINSLSNKKRLFSKLQDKSSVGKVFDVLSARYQKDREVILEFLKQALDMATTHQWQSLNLWTEMLKQKKLINLKKLKQKKKILHRLQQLNNLV